MFRIIVTLVVAGGLGLVPTGVKVGLPVETHCVLFVVDQLPSGKLVLSEPTCFADEADADASATVGPSSQLTSPTLSESIRVNASSTFTLGKHYEGLNGSGSSVTVVGSSCTGGWWNTSSSWDNRISSSYNGCGRLRHWDYPNTSGSSENTYGAGTTDNLTYMDNRTESVSYHSS